MEPEVSLPCSQELATGLYHEPNESSQRHPNLFILGLFYPTGTRALSLGVKRPGREVDH